MQSSGTASALTVTAAAAAAPATTLNGSDAKSDDKSHQPLSRTAQAFIDQHKALLVDKKATDYIPQWASSTTQPSIVITKSDRDAVVALFQSMQQLMDEHLIDVSSELIDWLYNRKKYMLALWLSEDIINTLKKLISVTHLDDVSTKLASCYLRHILICKKWLEKFTQSLDNPRYVIPVRMIFKTLVDHGLQFCAEGLTAHASPPNTLSNLKRMQNILLDYKSRVATLSKFEEKQLPPYLLTLAASPKTFKDIQTLLFSWFPFSSTDSNQFIGIAEGLFLLYRYTNLTNLEFFPLWQIYQNAKKFPENLYFIASYICFTVPLLFDELPDNYDAALLEQAIEAYKMFIKHTPTYLQIKKQHTTEMDPVYRHKALWNLAINVQRKEFKSLSTEQKRFFDKTKVEAEVARLKLLPDLLFDLADASHSMGYQLLSAKLCQEAKQIFERDSNHAQDKRFEQITKRIYGSMRKMGTQHVHQLHHQFSNSVRVVRRVNQPPPAAEAKKQVKKPLKAKVAPIEDSSALADAAIQQKILTHVNEAKAHYQDKQFGRMSKELEAAQQILPQIQHRGRRYEAETWIKDQLYLHKEALAEEIKKDQAFLKKMSDTPDSMLLNLTVKELTGIQKTSTAKKTAVDQKNQRPVEVYHYATLFHVHRIILYLLKFDDTDKTLYHLHHAIEHCLCASAVPHNGKIVFDNVKVLFQPLVELCLAKSKPEFAKHVKKTFIVKRDAKKNSAEHFLQTLKQSAMVVDIMAAVTKPPIADPKVYFACIQKIIALPEAQLKDDDVSLNALRMLMLICGSIADINPPNPFLKFCKEHAWKQANAIPYALISKGIGHFKTAAIPAASAVANSEMAAQPSGPPGLHQ